MEFKPAIRRQRFLRAAFFGPSGSGKTLTSLIMMRGIVGPQGRIAVIDTERGSANMYADLVQFDTVWLTEYAATDYIACIKQAEAAKYDGLIIDSASHAWEGEGGLLSVVENVIKGQKKEDSFRAWGDERVRHAEHSFWNTILDFPGHVIVTMRAKTSYEVSKNENGKTVIQKLGLAPVQRQSAEYEFDLICRFTAENEMWIEKARDPECKLEGRCITKPGADFADEISAWLKKGDTPIDDYRTRINKTCEEVAAMTQRPLAEIRKEARELIANKHGTNDITTLSNMELDGLPDLIRALVPSPKEEAQLRQAQRDNKKKEATTA